MAKGDQGTPATLALTRAGIEFTTHPYAHDPRHPNFGEEAATALGLSTAAVFKTLVALVDGAPVVAIVPVAGTLDLKALAAAAGAGPQADPPAHTLGAQGSKPCRPPPVPRVATDAGDGSASTRGAAAGRPKDSLAPRRS